MILEQSRLDNWSRTNQLADVASEKAALVT
jgi:hypothetical protein